MKGEKPQKRRRYLQRPSVCSVFLLSACPALLGVCRQGEGRRCRVGPREVMGPHVGNTLQLAVRSSRGRRGMGRRLIPLRPRSPLCCLAKARQPKTCEKSQAIQLGWGGVWRRCRASKPCRAR